MDPITIIGDVTQTLRDLLQDSQEPDPWYRVSLKSPAEVKTTQSMTPQINLFLFHIKPNPMGNGQPRFISPTRRQEPPLALYLYYALTTFAENKLDEHRVLGSAMGVFNRFAIIEKPQLRGTLANVDDPLKLDFCNFSLEDQARIWNLMNTDYRLTVFYRVRVVLLESEDDIFVPRTEEVVNRVEDRL